MVRNNNETKSNKMNGSRTSTSRVMSNNTENKQQTSNDAVAKSGTTVGSFNKNNMSSNQRTYSEATYVASRNANERSGESRTNHSSAMSSKTNTHRVASYESSHKNNSQYESYTSGRGRGGRGGRGGRNVGRGGYENVRTNTEQTIVNDLSAAPAGGFLKSFFAKDGCVVKGDTSRAEQICKILAGATSKYIKFKISRADSVVVIQMHTGHMPNNSVFIRFQDKLWGMNVVMPYRSVKFTCDESGENFKLIDYSIRRFDTIANEKILEAVREKSSTTTPEGVQVFDSQKHFTEVYEGPIIVAHSDGSLRTTSCGAAKDSHFGSKTSHGEQFEDVCKKHGFDSAFDACSKLSNAYPNCYFVFVLVGKETRRFCLYKKNNGFTDDGEGLVLINVRNSDTQMELPNWRDTVPKGFLLSKQYNLQEAEEYFDSSSVFDGEFLGTMGLMCYDRNGNAYRSYTKAYERIDNIMPQCSNVAIGALSLFMKNKEMLPLFLKLRGLDNTEHWNFVCMNAVYGLCNILSALYSRFTELSLGNNHRMFTKRNGELYDMLKSDDKEVSYAVTLYKRALAELQKYSISTRQSFNNPRYMSKDISNWLSEKANYDVWYVVALIKNYEVFEKTYVYTTQKHNTTLPIKDQLPVFSNVLRDSMFVFNDEITKYQNTKENSEADEDNDDNENDVRSVHSLESEHKNDGENDGDDDGENIDLVAMVAGAHAGI